MRHVSGAQFGRLFKGSTPLVRARLAERSTGRSPAATTIYGYGPEKPVSGPQRASYGPLKAMPHTLDDVDDRYHMTES